MKPALIKATVTLEKSLWVVLFERNDDKGYAAARQIFGSEPTDPEIYDFVIHNFDQLRFTEPQEFTLVIKRKNPKRIKREVRKEMTKAKVDLPDTTLAQEALRIELEKNKKVKKVISKQEKEAEKERMFLLKQAAKKQKQRGH